MTQKTFFLQLALVTALLFGVLYALAFATATPTYNQLSFYSVCFFVFLSIVLFFWGKAAAISPDTNAFSRLALGSLTAKMFLAMIMVAAYSEIMQPESKFFLLPFMIIYFTYTIFETYFLMRIGKRELPKPRQDQKENQKIKQKNT